MRHQRPVRRAMPVRLSARDVNDITNLQPSRLLPFTADQPAAHRDGQDLAALVGVPEGAGLQPQSAFVGDRGADQRNVRLG